MNIRHDLYALTVVQCIVEWHDLPVHFRYRELVSYLTMDRIGEVDRCGSLRKSDDISLWREDEYLIRKDAHIHLTHELSSFERVFYDFFDRRYPVAIFRFYRCSLFCIFEMRSHSDFCLDMHLFCTYLDLGRLRAHFWEESDDGGMERLVSVFFREGDIVLEPFWHRDEYVMQDSEYFITSGYILCDYADSKKVVEISSMAVGVFFSLKFFVYAVWRLDPIGYIDDRDALGDHLANYRFCLSDEILLLFSHALELSRDRHICLGMEHAKTLGF